MNRRVVWELAAVEQLLTFAKTDRDAALRAVARSAVSPPATEAM